MVASKRAGAVADFAVHDADQSGACGFAPIGQGVDRIGVREPPIEYSSSRGFVGSANRYRYNAARCLGHVLQWDGQPARWAAIHRGRNFEIRPVFWVAQDSNLRLDDQQLYGRREHGARALVSNGNSSW